MGKKKPPATPPPPPTDDQDLFAEEAEKKPLQLGLILRLLTLTRPYALKRNILLSVVLVRSMQLPLLVVLVGWIIGGPIAEGNWSLTIGAVVAYAVFALFTEGLHHFRQRLALELGEAVVHDLRNQLFTHLLSMPMSFFNKTRLGSIISRVTSDIEALRMGVQSVLFVSMVQLGQMIVAGAFMLYYDWVLFLVISGLVPILWAITRYFRERLSTATRAVQASFSRVTSSLAESVNGIRVTQGFVRHDLNNHYFRHLVEDHSRYNIRLARTSAVFIPLLELNSQFFIAILLFIGGWRVLDPGMSMEPSDLIQFFFLANLFFSPIQVIGNQYNTALLAMAGAERVFRVLDTKPEWTDPPDARPVSGITGEVTFCDVTFSYDPGRPVLREVSFSAEPGQTIALVGHTGSGKSTIVSLLTKFYLPDSGRILIDGQDLASLESASLHRFMGLVQQVNFLFQGTVLDNIRFARPEASRTEVEQVLRDLKCEDLLLTLPDGLETTVGEKGGGLSLGQRQLVCFARAMIANPAILVMDEATSSIDALTEERLQDALRTLLQGRTSFVIAHRLSTIREADLVLVLRDGKIVERGKHDALIEEQGYYADLYRKFSESDD